MARNISFFLTTPQFIDGSKDVTRRNGWTFVKAGDILCAVKKGQGLGKGGKIERLGMIRIVDARRERLDRMITDAAYGQDEVRREGFHDMTPSEFVEFFCASHKGVGAWTTITRIEFEHL